MSKVNDKLPFFAEGTATKNKSILFNGSKREKFRENSAKTENDRQRQ
jgi:hypothetical protein